MGNSCNKGDMEKFRVSENCATQFLSDDKLNSEEKWMAKLRCLDEAHSKKKQLTQEDFDKILKGLENTIASKTQADFCKNKELLLECLKRNPTCSIKCNREMNNYIDCIDAIRINRIKDMIHEEQRRKT